MSHTYETQKICCFLADVQIILVSLFEFFDYIKVAKNAGAFLSRCSELLGLAEPSFLLSKPCQIKQFLTFFGSIIYEHFSRSRNKKNSKVARDQRKMLPSEEFYDGDVEMVVNPMQERVQKTDVGISNSGRVKKKFNKQFSSLIESLSFYMSLDVLKTFLFTGLAFSYVAFYIYILATSFGYTIYRTKVEEYFS